MRCGGVVLAGGRSSRMGRPKACLEWHGSTLLRRTTGLLGRVVDGPVVVVRAAGQELPPLPPAVEVYDDPQPDRGPLQGIAAGLTALGDRADAAFVCATDLPFLHAAFVAAVLRALTAEVEVALPVAAGHRQPLAAAYRPALAAVATELLEAGEHRPGVLFDRCRVAVVDEPALRADARLMAADPDLASVRNVNDPQAYADARARPAPTVTVQRFGALAAAGSPRTGQVAAATLGQAALAVGLPLDRHLLAAVNGDQVSRDPELPLLAGDTVAFLSADAGG